MSTDTLIADRIEIADLFTRFALLLDEGRWQDADTVFTDDVAVHSPRGGELRGIDKVVGFMRQGEVEGQHAQHTTTDLLVDIRYGRRWGGDSARCRSYPPGHAKTDLLAAAADTTGVWHARDQTLALAAG